MLSPQQIIDAGLAASRSDGCVVVVRANSEANVRWANNTVTTSGFATGLDWFVVAVSGSAAAAVSGSAADASSPDAVAAVVRAAEAAAGAAGASGPARDARPLVAGGAEDAFGDAAAETEFGVFGRLLDGLADAMDSAQIRRPHPVRVRPARGHHHLSRIVHRAAATLGATHRHA